MSLKEAAAVLSVLIMVGANTTARLRVVILFVSLYCATLIGNSGEGQQLRLMCNKTYYGVLIYADISNRYYGIQDDSQVLYCTNDDKAVQYIVV